MSLELSQLRKGPSRDGVGSVGAVDVQQEVFDEMGGFGQEDGVAVSGFDGVEETGP